MRRHGKRGSQAIAAAVDQTTSVSMTPVTIPVEISGNSAHVHQLVEAFNTTLGTMQASINGLVSAIEQVCGCVDQIASGERR